jgi:uncharacterized protein (TIRG00374 family)
VASPSHHDLKKARKTGLWMVFLTIIVLLAMIVALRSLPQTEESTKDIINRINPYWLVLSLISMSLAFVCMAARWRVLMPDSVKPPLNELTGLICAGLLLNYAAPGPVGELGAAWFAHKRYSITLEDALASGVSARLLGLMTTAVLGFVIWLIFPMPISPEYEQIIMYSTLAVGAGGIFIAFLAGFPRWWQNTLIRVTEWLPLKKYKDAGVSVIKRITDALIRVLRHRPIRYFHAVSWSIGAHTAVTTGVVFAAISLGSSFDLSGIAFTYTITTAAAVLLFAFPGSYLGWDALFLGLLVTTAGISLPDATAIALIVRVQQIGYMGLGGISLRWLSKGIESQHNPTQMG